MPTTVVFANEVDTNDAYGYEDVAVLNDASEEEITADDFEVEIIEVEDNEPWTEGEVAEWDELLEENEEVRERSVYFFESTEFNEEAVDLRETHLTLYDVSHALGEADIFELVFEDAKEGIAENTEAFEVLVEQFEALIEWEEEVEIEDPEMDVIVPEVVPEVMPEPEEVPEVEEEVDPMASFTVTTVGSHNPSGQAVFNANAGSHVNVQLHGNLPAGHRVVWHANVSGVTFETTGVTALFGNSRVRFTMPHGNVTITATLQRMVTVVGGTSTSTWNPNSTINVNANNAPTNYRFSHWSVTGASGVPIGNATNRNTTVIAPNVPITVTANFVRATSRLTINRGSAPLSRAQGTVTGSRANARAGATYQISVTPPSGYVFNGWNGGHSGTFGNRNSARTTFRMPNHSATWNPSNVTLTPTFRQRVATSPTINRRLPAVVRNANVPLRRGPGANFHLSQRIGRGTTVTILHHGRNNWRYVQITGGRRGWIQANQLTQVRTSGIITRPNVSFRRGPGLSGNSNRQIRRVALNTTVTILGTTRDLRWTQIQIGNTTGWVESRHVGETTQAGRTNQRIAFRRGPGTNFGTIRTLNNNTNLRILGRQGNWSRVRVGNTTGWIQTSRVRVNTPTQRVTGSWGATLYRGPQVLRADSSRLNGGTRVTVLARYRNWSRVRLGNGRTGWVLTIRLS